MPLPAADERNRFAQHLFAPLPARYDRLAELLSFGQNGRWRRAMVDHITAAAPANGAVPGHATAPGGTAPGGTAPGGTAPGGTKADGTRADGTNADSTKADSTKADGKLILDVAAGTAGVSIQIARRTAATVIGVDLTEQMLRQGRQNVSAAGQSARISLVAGRAERLPFPDASFDALTFTYLLRYVDDPQATLAELARVVKPGGLVASLEFLAPPAPFWRFWWWLYTRLALPAGGLLTGGREWYEVGRFLGPSISGHYRRYPVDWTADAWRRAGLRDVGVRVMSLGGGLVMWGIRAGE